MDNTINDTELQKHEKCCHYLSDFNFDNESIRHYCSPDAKTLGKKWANKHEIDIRDCETCSRYESRFIEFPLTVQGIEVEKPRYWDVEFTPVRVRPCGENKTYFGILLGYFPWVIKPKYKKSDGKLIISTISNPCILLPEQKKIVFGAECWWSKIKDMDDVSDITDIDIDNQWYIKLLKDIADVHE